MCASCVVGWESRWEVVKRFGAVSAGGMESRKVVDVPRERMASPGVDSAMTVAGLSPVKGAMPHSRNTDRQHIQSRVGWNCLPGLKPQRSTQ